MPTITTLRKTLMTLRTRRASRRGEPFAPQPHRISENQSKDTIASQSSQSRTFTTVSRPPGTSDSLWAAAVLLQPIVTQGEFNIILHLQGPSTLLPRVWAIRAYLTRLVRDVDGEVVRSKLSKKVQASAKPLARAVDDHDDIRGECSDGEMHYYVVFHFHADEGIWEFMAPDLVGDRVLIKVTRERTLCQPRRADIVVDLLRSREFAYSFSREDVQENHFFGRLPRILEEREEVEEEEEGNHSRLRIRVRKDLGKERKIVSRR